MHVIDKQYDQRLHNTLTETSSFMMSSMSTTTEQLSTLKAVKSGEKWLYDKDKLTLMAILYEVYEVSPKIVS